MTYVCHTEAANYLMAFLAYAGVFFIGYEFISRVFTAWHRRWK